MSKLPVPNCYACDHSKLCHAYRSMEGFLHSTAARLVMDFHQNSWQQLYVTLAMACTEYKHTCNFAPGTDGRLYCECGAVKEKP